MKSFYSATAEALESPTSSPVIGSQSPTAVASRARVAIYDAPAAAPRIVDIEPAGIPDYIEALASTVYRLAQEQGGDIPYSVVREVSENLIHAEFSEPVVSIMDKGRTIRFADSGPGIRDKERAVLPGFTTASSEMKRFIRGVGSGLPLVREFLGHSGGGLVVEDNLGCGAVVTVTSSRLHTPLGWTPPVRSAEHSPVQLSQHPAWREAPSMLLDQVDTQAVARPSLTTRQTQVLALVMESGSAGPSLVSRELTVGVSTAYRDLASLEEMGLIVADGGKRSLTDEGLSYLDTLTSGS